MTCRAGIIIGLITLVLGDAALAESLVASRTLRSQSVITAQDIALSEKTVPGAIRDPGLAIGMETRIVLYAGHPIRESDLVPPAIVERNGFVVLIFDQPGLEIRAEGRALGRGGAGDVIRVMNLGSKTTVSGMIRADGSVQVGNHRSRRGN